jgi:hypothetical protein
MRVDEVVNEIQEEISEVLTASQKYAIKNMINLYALDVIHDSDLRREIMIGFAVDEIFRG